MTHDHVLADTILDNYLSYLHHFDLLYTVDSYKSTIVQIALTLLKPY